jgi:hypothetical protein
MCSSYCWGSTHQTCTDQSLQLHDGLEATQIIVLKTWNKSSGFSGQATVVHPCLHGL